MSATAFQKQFRQETIAGFEKRRSVLSMSVTTEANVRGNEAEFLVADSGGATAVRRGTNGLIPSRNDNNTQTTVTLQEWHDKVRKNDFDVTSSQGDQRRIMQESCMSVINRTIDEQIYDALDQSSLDWNSGSAAAATVPLVLKTKATLKKNYATDGDVFAVISSMFHAQLMTNNRFTSADYINDKRFEDRGVSKDQAFSWLGVNWIVDDEMPGVGTAAAKCFMYARSAIGHAAHASGMQTFAGYDEEDGYSFVRASIGMNAGLLQTSGVVEMLHDDTAAIAAVN